MTMDTVDKCLGFASGEKSYQVATGIRNPDFPQNLIYGTDKERRFRRYREEGMTFDEIKKLQGKSTRAGYYFILDTMQRKEDLYNAWVEFWTEAEKIRPVRLSVLCEGMDENTGRFLKKIESLGVFTVEDFLVDCTTLTLEKMRKKYGRSSPDIKRARIAILNRIRECFSCREDGMVFCKT